MQKPNTAYLLARLPIGMSMLTHGLERIPKLSGFSMGMVKQFAKSPLPAGLVQAFGTVLPFLELLTGLLLLVGLFIRFANILGILVMLALIFGSGMIEQWNAVFTQIVYGAYFALLYLYSDYNRYAVDGLLKKS
jgi:thiosulfate dehydrogenase [quinone] large subunit